MVLTTTGFYVNGSVGLAMRRLAIIDLKSGQQPIHNQDRSSWIVFNGEIYNYLELREKLEKLGHTFYTNSDTEAIVHAYDQFGADCPKHLRGMFAFAIWNERTQELFLARDRVGKKPLLYAHVNGNLIFGSEFSALLLHPDVSRDIQPEALDYYLSFMCIPAPLTAYKAIRKLEPGHWLRWRKGEIEHQRYWQPDFTKKLDIDEEEAGERTVEILREAVRVRLMSEVPLGAFLSGGIDSSAVVALMAQESSERVKTFSIGFDEQDFSELHHARRIAEHVGADHHEFIVRPDAVEVLPILVEHYGEPYADSSAVPTYYVARETRKHVTVALNGDGGDESFAGYERYIAMGLTEKYRRVPSFLRESVIKETVNLIPSSATKRSRVKSAKRLLEAVSLPRVDRYTHWVSVFNDQTKQPLYSDFFRQQTRGDESDRIACGVVQAGQRHRHPRRNAFDGSDDLSAKRSAGESRHCDDGSFAGSAFTFSRSSRDRVCRELAAESEAAAIDEQVSFEKGVAQTTSKREPQSTQNGFWSSDRPLVPWQDAAVFCVRLCFQRRQCGEVCSSRKQCRQLIELHTRGERDYSHQLWTLLMLELWFQRFID